MNKNSLHWSHMLLNFWCWSLEGKSFDCFLGTQSLRCKSIDTCCQRDTSAMEQRNWLNVTDTWYWPYLYFLTGRWPALFSYRWLGFTCFSCSTNTPILIATSRLILEKHRAMWVVSAISQFQHWELSGVIKSILGIVIVFDRIAKPG